MHIIQNILIILQILGFGVFVHSAYAFKTEYDLKITFYNAPSIIMLFIALLAGSYLCVTHLLWFLLFGVITAAISWIVNSLVPFNEEQPTIYRKLLSASIALLFWHQTIVILIIVFSNKDKINYEKFQP